MKIKPAHFVILAALAGVIGGLAWDLVRRQMLGRP